MPALRNPIVDTYSELAEKYDQELNARSCWGRASEKALHSLRLKGQRVVADIGCGTGEGLARLASGGNSATRFLGVDPAENMRRKAAERNRAFANVVIRDGSFESIPAQTASIDYLYSIFAFHWTTDLEASVRELARVLKPSGEMDLFFIGRNNGREFIQKTSPIFLKYMGPALLLESARMRKQLTREETFLLFAKTFDPARLSVEESYETYYDSLEGHWGWWVRIEGHFVRIPPEKKRQCNDEVKAALSRLDGERGIPYTIHQLHVRFNGV